MTFDLLTCYNKGCGIKFKLEENVDDCCIYHPGVPEFHDALKGWTCCKKRVTDFTEFLNIKGCTMGSHSNVKPPEPEKKKPLADTEPMLQPETKPKHRPPKPTPMERPPADEVMIPLKTTIGASLRTQLEKLSLSDKTEAESEEVFDENNIKVGTSCNNKGCKASFEGESSRTETCVFHPGVPIFHEGMKYWTCCQRKTSDFETFLNQEGCQKGLHKWFKPKSEQLEEKKVRWDWHQTTSTVCVSIFAKVAVPEQTTIEANRVSCVVSIVYEGGKSTFSKTFVFREAINPEKSQVKLLGTKVELDFKKAEGFSWSSLELPEK